jgi:hypothetical protein
LKKAIGISLIVLGIAVVALVGLTKGLVLIVVGAVMLSPKLLDKIAARKA